jgi:hypothetical protein
MSSERATQSHTPRSTVTCSATSARGQVGIASAARGTRSILEKYKARLCEAYGKVQPEYVEVPDSLLPSTAELKKYFDSSYAYVSTLKPKLSPKKKKG